MESERAAAAALTLPGEDVATLTDAIFASTVRRVTILAPNGLGCLQGVLHNHRRGDFA